MNWDKANKVRVKEHLYGEFRRKVRAFKNNAVAYNGKYIRKQYNVAQHLNGYLMLDGIGGAFNKTLFHCLQVKAVTDILEMVRSKVIDSDGGYVYDSHHQDTNFAFADSTKHENTDPLDAIEGDLDGVHRYRGESCFSGLPAKAIRATGGRHDMMVGYYPIWENLTPDRLHKYIEVCYKSGIFPKGGKTYNGIFNTFYCWADGEYIKYRVFLPVDGSMDYKRLFFCLNYVRFVKEYSGSINIAMDLVEQEGMNFHLAMILALCNNPRQRWLHVPYNANACEDDFYSYVAFARGIASFCKRSMYGIKTTQYKTADIVHSMYLSEREKLRKKPAFSLEWDTKYMTQFNQLIMEAI